jgi:hypothetical protein
MLTIDGGLCSQVKEVNLKILRNNGRRDCREQRAALETDVSAQICSDIENDLVLFDCFLSAVFKMFLLTLLRQYWNISLTALDKQDQ